MVHDYKQLKIWEEARFLCGKIYEITKPFPKEEQYGLTSQMRRCSVSIASNISEGSGSGSNKNFVRYLHMSIASLCEIELSCI